MKNPFRRRPKSDPSEEAIMVWVDAAISMAEEFTREAVRSLPVRTPGTPVVPGDIPNAARVMIQYWQGSNGGLIESLRGAYQLSEPTARLWIRIGKRGF